MIGKSILPNYTVQIFHENLFCFFTGSNQTNFVKKLDFVARQN